MPLTNAGRDHMVQAALGEVVTAFNNAASHIGVGDGATVFAVGQTDLQGASKTRKAMDATYPQRAGNAVTFRSTFGTGDANYAWQEWGVFNGAAGGTMLNRKVESLGTKPGTQTWQFSVTVTVNVS